MIGHIKVLVSKLPSLDQTGHRQKEKMGTNLVKAALEEKVDAWIFFIFKPFIENLCEKWKAHLLEYYNVDGTPDEIQLSK